MSKKYIPKEKEKYMNAKHRAYFKERLIEWKKEIIKSDANNTVLRGVNDNLSAPDILDQASSQTEKSVEMRTGNFWNFSRPIPPSFYTGETGIEPIDDTIKKVLKTELC